MLFLSVPQHLPRLKLPAARLGRAERAGRAAALPEPAGARRRVKRCWLINFKPGVASPSSPEKNVDLAETQIKPN